MSSVKSHVLPYHVEDDVCLYLGDAVQVLRQLDSDSVDCVVTSPPYYRLRDYGYDEQIGQEDTFEEYIAVLVDVFAEVRRVLRPTGTLWLNIGDRWADGELQPASDVAYGLAQDGWLRAQTFIWHKTNATPYGAKRRSTQDHEYVFFLARQRDYFYEREGVMVPAKWERWGKQTIKKDYRGIKPIDMSTLDARRARGKPVRTVWSIPTKPYAGQHNAVAPPALLERCIRLGCPEGGTVLNPFVGSGTTALAARALGRRCIGIDIDAGALEQAISRLDGLSIDGQGPDRDRAAPLPRTSQ